MGWSYHSVAREKHHYSHSEADHLNKKHVFVAFICKNLLLSTYIYNLFETCLRFQAIAPASLLLMRLVLCCGGEIFDHIHIIEYKNAFLWSPRWKNHQHCWQRYKSRRPSRGQERLMVNRNESGHKLEGSLIAALKRWRRGWRWASSLRKYNGSGLGDYCIS